MDFIQGLISGAFNDPATVVWVIYVIAAIAGITLAIALYYLFSGLYSPVKVQLNKLTQESGPKQQDLTQAYEKSLEHDLDKLKHIPFINNSFSGDKQTKKLLIHAGFHSHNALRVYNAIKLISLIVAAAASSLLVHQFPDASTILTIYMIALVVGLAYILPGLILQKIANHRMRELRRYFPDALDLLVVCCEAGLGLLESFQRVSREMEIAHPYLAHEIALVCSKVRYGLSMQQALKEFSDRTGLEDIRGLNSVIVQSLRLGTGVAETIRVYSDEYRDKRLQQAEEKAAKLSVKMIFPMMFCIWPSFFIVAVGPAVLKIMNVWDKAF